MSEDYSHPSLSERMYFHEMSTWNSLSGQLQLILAILIVHIGFTWNVGEFLVINTFIDRNISLIVLVIWIIFGCGVVDLIKTVLSFWKGWHGYEYPTMITADELRSHKKEIFAQYKGFPNQEKLANDGFKKVLEEKFSEYASIAAKNNGYKFEHLYSCKLTLLPSISLIVISYILITIIR